MTSEETWSAVDAYFDERLLIPDATLERVLDASAEAGLPPAQVTPLQGQLLFILARMVQAERILEIGTLGGYSTIHLARALPATGRLVTLESSFQHAAVADANLRRAGLSGLVDIIVGPAGHSLVGLTESEPFDMVFIDADKAGNPEYLQWALRLTHPGSVIVADNVVRGGAVLETDSTDRSVLGVRRFTDMLGAEPRVAATVVQTVGSKGYDGFAIAVVTRPGW